MDARLGFTEAVKTRSHPGHRLIEPEEWSQIASEFGLTIREWAVVILLFRGLTCAEIAHQLSIKSRTVRQYLEHIHEKINVQDRVELVLRIIEARDEMRDESQDQ